MRTNIFLPLTIILLFTACGRQASENYERADKTLRAIYEHYGVEGEYLLRETFPFDENHQATYLADQDTTKVTNPFSYLWPFSGSLSAAVALYEVEKSGCYLDLLKNRVLPGLEEYHDDRHSPDGYASYIKTAPLSDRFYDDNIWIGLDFADLYLLTANEEYLDNAKMVWRFIESGTDTILGGGIYWCEQRKESKNTCSNAPGAVLALKLFEATNDSAYFMQGKKLYEWTKKNLQDEKDFLYYDNIRLNGRIGKTKYPYNSGQMIQAAALLYKLTGEQNYLTDAQNTAQACYEYFFHDFTTGQGETFRMLKENDVWFIAIMMRGFVELYSIDGNKEYLHAFQKNMEQAWNQMREENGLFNKDWTGKTKNESKWVLTQFAMVEMYARLSAVGL